MIKDEFFVLRNGIKIPKVGYGTWLITDEKECINGVLWALEADYRHIDTAAVYKNEEFIAKALAQTKVPREEIFITSKLDAAKKAYDIAIEEFNASLKRLQTDYLDLYLIHAPRPWGSTDDIDYTEANIASWKAMIDLYNQDKIKSIGVSNFSKTDIEALIRATGFIPHVNQIKVHIGYNNQETRDYCHKQGILVQAYCPLANGKIFSQKALADIAKKNNVSLAQLAIKWCLDINTLPLPKSVRKDRIKENIQLDFDIKKEDMDILSKWETK